MLLLLLLLLLSLTWKKQLLLLYRPFVGLMTQLILLLEKLLLLLENLLLLLLQHIRCQAAAAAEGADLFAAERRRHREPLVN